MENPCKKPDRQLLYSLVDQMLEPTVILDFEGALLHGNDLAAEVIGVADAGDIAGMSLTAIMHPESLEQAAIDLQEVQASEADFSATYKLLVDGRAVHIESHGTKIELADGEVDLVSFRDITARRVQEEKDKATQLMLNSVLDHSSTVIFVKDLDGKYLLINRRYEELFGITNDAIIGKTDHDVFPAEMADEFQRKDHKALEADGPIEEEELVPQDDGLHTYISVKFPLKDAAGKPYATCGIATDITDRKKMEDKAAELKRNIEFILGATKTGLDIMDRDYNLRYVTPSWRETYGDPTGKKCYEYFRNSKTVCEECGLPEAFATGEPVVSELTLPLENNRPLQVTSIPFETADGELLAAEVKVDISERKRVEDELREIRHQLEERVEERTDELEKSEQMFRALTESMNAMVVIASLEKEQAIYANPAATKLTGYSFEELTAHPAPQLFSEASLAETMRLRDAVMAGQPMPDRMEMEIITKGGEARWFESAVALIEIGDDGMHKVVTSFDITERKKAEEALKESEKKFRGLADLTNANIMMAGEDGRIFYANKAAEETTGYTMEELAELDPLQDLFSMPDKEPEWLEQVKRAAKTGEAITGLEMKIRTKDGRERWLEASGQFIELGGQMVDLSTSFDITDRKRAEEALKESEKKFRALADSTTAAIAIVGSGGEKFLYANQTTLDRAGMTWEEYAAVNPGASLSPEAFEAGGKAAAQAMGKGETNWRFEYQEEGGAWSEVNVVLTQLDGEAATIYTSFDITAIKRAQERVEIFQTFAETSGQGFGMSDLEGNITYINPAVARFTGLESSEQGVGKHVTDFHPKEYTKQLVEEVVPHVLEHGEWTGEMPMMHADGSSTPMILSMFLLRDESGEPQRFAAVLTDITEQKRAEGSLKDSEKKFRDLAESTTAQICIIQDDRYIYANQAFLDYYGVDTEDLLATTPEDLMMGMMGPAVMEAAEPAFQAAMDRGDSHFTFEYQDNEGTWLQANVTMMELEGKPAYMSTSFDITELKRAQEQLAENEERYRTIFDTAGTGMISFGEDGLITMANEEWIDLSGYSKEETIGELTWVPFFTEKSLEKMKKYHEMRSKDPTSVPSAYEAEFKDRKGEIHDGIVNIQLIPGTQQRVASFQDMTALKRAQAEMYRADKMAALGQIIAGVAHEINNPNNFIYFNLPILRRYIEAMSPLLETHLEKDPELEILNMPYQAFLDDVFKLLENMEHGSKRITGIVSELKNYVRSDEEKVFKAGRVKGVIDHVMALVGKQVRKMVKRFEVDVESGLPEVRMNEGKMEQVLINLVINAGQAADKDDSWVKLSARPAKMDGGEGVKILVEDNGAGVPEENLEQIFEPFFTSKGREQGTGLGLSISHRIVEEHGGTITVASEPGKGTTFTITLPGV